ncbi:MAG: OmpA family protein [Cytophagaceae bacterium]|jgi:outer membrane protein OmpA-like peptidoglycan-associated protein|nr:OmpA family protein [Cytophagaceae bacterium]
MKLPIIGLLVIFMLSWGNNALAQNPKQSKKYKVKKEKKRDPYTPVYHDKDSDGDGVPDGRDECIHTPKGEPVTPFGCPFDTDFDGVYDYEDLCKTEKGPKDNKGCPWGDRDQDGIKDNEDLCPDVFGVAKFKGCPDSDGDGIQDKDDKCPKEPGIEKYQGCPPPFIDTDKDGIDDYHDVCVKVPGVKSNKGCPEIKKVDQDAVSMAFKNLLFETNKDVIVESSFASLDALAKMLRNNPKYNLYLEGHTDSEGNDEANMDLSKRRSASVKKYLVAKGIKPERITTDGFGETRPVDSNDTENGRRNNRRVEMTIIQQ